MASKALVDARIIRHTRQCDLYTGRVRGLIHQTTGRLWISCAILSRPLDFYSYVVRVPTDGTLP